MSAVSGSPTQVKTSCATLADLAGVPDDAYLDGEIAYVSSVRRYFQIVRVDPTLVANGATIVATFSGNGFWVAVDFASTAWSSEPTWYIDATNGNDENPGTTAARALKSWAEFRRRVRLLSVSMTVHILTDLTEAIVGTFEAESPGLILTVVGTPVVLADAGAVTTFTNPSMVLNACAQGTMTSGAIADFAPYVGKFLRTPADKWAPILGVSGGGAPYLPFWSDDTFAGTMNTKPANGTRIDVVNLTAVLTIQLVLDGVSAVFKYLRTTSTNFNEGVNVLTSSEVGGPTFFACDIGSDWTCSADSHAIACLLSGTGSTYLYSPLFFIGGGSRRSLYLIEGGRAAFQGFVIQGGTLELGNGSSPSFPSTAGIWAATLGLGVFDSPVNGVSVGAGGSLVGATLYGAGNTGYGLLVDYGGKVQVTADPTITGAGGDLSFENGATAIPPLTGGAVVPAASALTTWAQWAAVPFNKKVMNYTTGSSLCR